LKKIINRRSFF